MSPLDLAALYMDVVPDAMREYRKEMRASRTGSLSIPQFRILAMIHREPINNRSLAEEQGVSVAAMSRMVDQLFKQGLVERRENETDRRQVMIAITELGTETFQTFRRKARTRLESRLCALNENEQLELKKALALLAGAIEQMNLATEGR